MSVFGVVSAHDEESFTAKWDSLDKGRPRRRSRDNIGPGWNTLTEDDTLE